MKRVSGRRCGLGLGRAGRSRSTWLAALGNRKPLLHKAQLIQEAERVRRRGLSAPYRLHGPPESHSVGFKTKREGADA